MPIAFVWLCTHKAKMWADCRWFGGPEWRMNWGIDSFFADSTSRSMKSMHFLNGWSCERCYYRILQIILGFGLLVKLNQAFCRFECNLVPNVNDENAELHYHVLLRVFLNGKLHDESSGVRHVRRMFHPGRGLGGPRARRSNMHFTSSTTGGLSTSQSSSQSSNYSREAMDPIAGQSHNTCIKEEWYMVKASSET